MLKEKHCLLLLHFPVPHIMHNWTVYQLQPLSTDPPGPAHIHQIH